MMSMRASNQPQNAIKQSNDYIQLGKNESALEILYEAIRIRRGKTWNASIHDAMESFLNLCLQLKCVGALRDGVTQFKILCQINNINSFDSLLTKFIQKCVDACLKAQEQSREKLSAEDLDEIETPETILLKSICETTAQDRTDRVHLLPILRFTWEVLRSLLDICKNNKNLDKFYVDVCDRAYKFVSIFTRRIEFRKLCELTRSHLSNILKFNNNTLAIDLTDSPSIEIQLEIRLNQLDCAINMELWNEAFKTMEDIHFLLRRTKKPPHPKILAIFYQKIALVFAKSNEPLFHAIALQKLYILIKEHKKNLKPEDLVKISSRVILATLSIPMHFERAPFECLVTPTATNTPAHQLGSILGLTTIPSRSKVVSDADGMLKYADSSVINIFNAIQNARTRFDLCKYVNLQVSAFPVDFSDDLSPYVDSIRRVAFTKILTDLSEVCLNIPLDSLVRYSHFYSHTETLAILLEISRHRLVNFTFDGEANVIRFKKETEFNDGKVFYNLVSDIDRIYFQACAQQTNNKCQLLLDDFWQDPYKEFERYNNIGAHITEYLNLVSKAEEGLVKRVQELMIQEQEKIETAEIERLEAERRQRDEERQGVDPSSIAESDSIRPLENAIVGVPVAEAVSVTKDVNAHVKKMKRIEKFMDTCYFAKRALEEVCKAEYITKDAERRQISWNQREKEHVAAIHRSKQLETDCKNRLLSAKSDLEVFLKESENIAQKAHQRTMEEYKHMLDKERCAIYDKMKAEYIEKKKREYVAKLKSEFYSKRDFSQHITPSLKVGDIVKPNVVTTGGASSTSPVVKKYVPKKSNIAAFTQKPQGTPLAAEKPKTTLKSPFVGRGQDYGL